MVPHEPCRLCGLTDDQVRFVRHDVCEVCRMRELRGLGPRDVVRAKQRKDPRAQVCPTCGGWKATARDECLDCMLGGRRRDPDVCQQCGAELSSYKATLCRACYLAQGGVCREPGPHGGRMTRRDLCHRHYQQMWRAGRLSVDSSAYEARETRFRERAAAVDPSLMRFLEARREREAAQERRDAAQRARAAVLRARRREAARGAGR